VKTGVLIARILLGLIFLVFGLNGFLHFMPQPPMPERAVTFFTGLAARATSCRCCSRRRSWAA
jgi:putative oxidoreductase